MSEELEQAIFWYNRLKHEEGLHLTDLCISTVQRNVRILVRHVQPLQPDQISRTYRGLCPNCGRTVELEQE